MNKLQTLLDHPKISALILGSLSVLALPPCYIFPVLFISFPGLFLLLSDFQTKKRSFALGYWFGFGYFAFGLSWIGNALLIDIATTGWLYPIVFLTNGFFFGLFFAFPALACCFFKSLPAKILAFAGMFTIFEWIRSFIFTGFPWNQLGSILAFSTPTLQLASIIGTYGLSLLVVLICGWPAVYIITKQPKTQIFPTVLITLIIVFGFARILVLGKIEDSQTKIRIVQPSIAQSMKWDEQELDNNFKEYIEMSRKEGFDDVNIVIWGETATPFFLDRDEQRLKEIIEAVPQNGYLITGLVRAEPDAEGTYRPLNSMFIIDKEGIVDFYDKFHLVPFGEYIPFRKFLPSSLKPVTQVIADFKAGYGHKNIYLDEKIPSLGALICYEIIFPSDILNIDDKPKWLVNLTNDGWYGDSSGPRQHLVTARLRAVEEGITIARVANTGISALISKTGKILGRIPLNKKAVLDINLPKHSTTTTLYGQFGNIIPIILSILSIVIASILCHIRKG